MTTKVTKESLAKKIKALESRGNAEYALGLTLNEEYQLKAYRMLLDLIPECNHDWYRPVKAAAAQCRKCGRTE